MPRAISYARFSHERQASGDSLRRQLDATRAYCAQHGLTLLETDILTDEGLSGWKGDHRSRGELGRFLDAVKAGRIEPGTTLVIEALDRLSRENPTLALNQLTSIVLSGIRVVTLIDKQEYDKDNPLKLFHSLGVMIGANAESENKSKRVREARQKAREAATESRKPMTKMVPAWIDVVDGKLVPNGGAAVVRRIFRDVADGLGTYTVARRLNAERVTTLSGGKKSNGWNKSRILAIVQSDAPLGWFQPHVREGTKRKPVGEPIKGYYPSIVDQTLADRARHLISTRRFGGQGAGRKGTVFSNLFTGIAKCGKCGGSMFLSHRHTPSLKAGWLRCNRAVRDAGADKEPCNNNIGIPYARFEKAVIERIGWHLKLRDQVHDSPADEINENIARKKFEVSRIEASIATVLEQFSETPIPLIKSQIEKMGDRHSSLLTDIESLQNQATQATLKSSMSSSDLERLRIIQNIESSDRFEKFNARAQIASILRMVIERMDCNPDRTVRVWFEPMRTKVHQMHLSLLIDTNNTGENGDTSQAPFMTVSLVKKPEIKREFSLEGLTPVAFTTSLLEAETQGFTIFDVAENDGIPAAVILIPPLALQQQVVLQTELIRKP